MGQIHVPNWQHMMAAIKIPKGSQPNRGSPTELTAKKTRAAVTTAGMAHVAALVQLRYLKITYQLLGTPYVSMTTWRWKGKLLYFV